MLSSGRSVDVRGSRVRGNFLTEVVVDGRVVARAQHRNWRMSYKILSVELSKAVVA
jgi:hypothetical protein